MLNLLFLRVYETGQEINLEKLETQLAASHNISRARFARVKPKSINLENPPLLFNLGNFKVRLENEDVTISARVKIFDLGALSIGLYHERSGSTSQDIERLAVAFAGQAILEQEFLDCLNAVLRVLEPELPGLQVDPEFYEDYSIVHFASMAKMPDPAVVLLGEHTAFSPQIREDIEKNRLAYSTEDMAYISWDSALLCDPEQPWDLVDLIEFANVQLLALRSYDRILARHLDQMYDDISDADLRRQFSRIKRYHQIMTGLMELIADVNEVFERIDNLIKITEDTYYARIYEITLRVLRVASWKESVQRKMHIINQTYSMLSNEVNVQHSNFLEWTIIILIALEFGFAIWQSLL